jgi:hypothetical protein
MFLCAHITRFWGVSIIAFSIFSVFWLIFWLSHRGGGPFYFDPQDCFAANPQRRVLPISAKTATFEPMLKHYVGVTQLIVTVAAASIAFGNNVTSASPVVIAKLILAWSIFYGVLFCALLLWRYDEYAQDMRSYTTGWYSTVFALGFSSLSCFMLGYLAWGYGLSKMVQ